MMNEKIMSAIYEEYTEGSNFTNLPDTDEAYNNMNNFMDELKKVIQDQDMLNKLDMVVGMVNAANERQGFYYGFKAAYNFLKSLQE